MAEGSNEQEEASLQVKLEAFTNSLNNLLCCEQKTELLCAETLEREAEAVLVLLERNDEDSSDDKLQELGLPASLWKKFLLHVYARSDALSDWHSAALGFDVSSSGSTRELSRFKDVSEVEVQKLVKLLGTWNKRFLNLPFSIHLLEYRKYAVSELHDRPRARKLCCEHTMQWLCRTLSPEEAPRSLRGDPETLTMINGFLLVGLTDVWSAIRKSCAAFLSDLLSSYDVESMEPLFSLLTQTCCAEGTTWQGQEGCLLGIANIVRKFRWSRAANDNHTIGTNESYLLKFGQGAPTSTLPPFIATQDFVNLLYKMLAHPQLGIRENATKAFSAYLSRIKIKEVVVIFQNIVERMQAGLTYEEYQQAATAEGCGLLLEPYESEGLLGVCTYIIKHIETGFLLPKWPQYFFTFSRYLSHPASTVRQATSIVFKYIVAKDGSNPTMMKLVLQGLAADWNVGSSGQLGTHEQNPTKPWEWQEGRLLAYELVLRFLLTNHSHYLFPLALMSGTLSHTQQDRPKRRNSRLGESSISCPSPSPVKGPVPSIRAPSSTSKLLAQPQQFHSEPGTQNDFQKFRLPSLSASPRYHHRHTNSDGRIRPEDIQQAKAAARSPSSLGGSAEPRTRRESDPEHPHDLDDFDSEDPGFIHTSSPRRGESIDSSPTQPMSGGRRNSIRTGMLQDHLKTAVRVAPNQPFKSAGSLKRLRRPNRTSAGTNTQFVRTRPLLTEVVEYEKQIAQEEAADSDYRDILSPLSPNFPHSESDDDVFSKTPVPAPNIVLSPTTNNKYEENSESPSPKSRKRSPVSLTAPDWLARDQQNSSPPPKWVDTSRFQPFAIVLKAMYFQTVECMASDRFELRRIASMVLPLLTETINWFNPRVLHDMWHVGLKGDQRPSLYHNSLQSFRHGLKQVCRLLSMQGRCLRSDNGLEFLDAVNKLQNHTEGAIKTFLPTILETAWQPEVTRVRITSLEILLILQTSFPNVVTDADESSYEAAWPTLLGRLFEESCSHSLSQPSPYSSRQLLTPPPPSATGMLRKLDPEGQLPFIISLPTSKATRPAYSNGSNISATSSFEPYSAEAALSELLEATYTYIPELMDRMDLRSAVCLVPAFCQVGCSAFLNEDICKAAMEGLHRIIDRCGEHQAQQEIDDVDGDYHWLTAKIGRLGLIILFRLTSAISEMQAVFMDVLLPKLRLKVSQDPGLSRRILSVLRSFLVALPNADLLANTLALATVAVKLQPLAPYADSSGREAILKHLSSMQQHMPASGDNSDDTDSEEDADGRNENVGGDGSDSDSGSNWDSTDDEEDDNMSEVLTDYIYELKTIAAAHGLNFSEIAAKLPNETQTKLSKIFSVR
eukprot:m.28520 g.28520  ORF g.28520 m.28520 type:complete len:1346 (+) comp8008_c0_seq1:235-4272(+)